MRRVLWALLVLTGFGLPAACAAEAKPDDPLNGYPDELKKYVKDLYKYVDGLGVSADLKDDLKQEGVLYMLVNRKRLDAPRCARRGCTPWTWTSTSVTLPSWRATTRTGSVP